MKDLEFISGDFMENEVPADRRFLLKYFCSEVQLAFLRYYLTFGNWECFVAHTGHVCTRAYLRKQEAKYRTLISVWENAKTGMTDESLTVLRELDTGSYKVDA
jgi:hypothetical protein